jgi:hypothetical protein
MGLFLDIEWASLTKTGEEVCGDTVRIDRLPDRALLVMSDGLGSGIQASVSSILTTEILVNMLRSGVPLEESVRTVASTIPFRTDMNASYATFLAVDIDRLRDGATITNYGNPPVLFFRRGMKSALPPQTITVAGKELTHQSTVLQPGDTLVVLSDGFPGSTTDVFVDDGCTIASLSRQLEQTMLTKNVNASFLIKELSAFALKTFGGSLRDDATVLILQVRAARNLTVLTGPPSDRSRDESVVNRFTEAQGRKAVCGGTTGEIVSVTTGALIRTVNQSAVDGLPPWARMEGIDLVTEGVLTLTRTIEYLARCKGIAQALPVSKNAAVLLAQELLYANCITFIVGLAENESYGKQRLPSSSLFRRSVVSQLVNILEALGKEVAVEYC